MSEYKVKSLLTFLAVLMSDSHADVSNYNFQNVKFDCRMNLIGNIAFVKYFDIAKFIKTSTFYERVFEFWYKLERKQVREKTERLEKKPRLAKLPNRFASSCSLPVSLKAEVHRLSDSLMGYGYEETNVRYDNLVEGWLAGHAIFNGRRQVCEEDIQVFEYMKKHLIKLL